MKKVVILLLPLVFSLLIISKAEVLLKLQSGSVLSSNNDAVVFIGGAVTISESALIRATGPAKFLVAGDMVINGDITPGSATFVLTGASSATISSIESSSFHSLAVGKEQTEAQVFVTGNIYLLGDLFVFGGRIVLKDSDALNVEGNIYLNTEIENNGTIEIGK